MKDLEDCMILFKKKENIDYHMVKLKSGYRNKILTVLIKLPKDIFKDLELLKVE